LGLILILVHAKSNKYVQAQTPKITSGSIWGH
jgi:hypothetical protein